MRFYNSSGALLPSLLIMSLLASLLIYVPITSVGTVEASINDNWVVVSHSPYVYNYGVAVVGAKENVYILNSDTGNSHNIFMSYSTVTGQWTTTTPPQWAKNGSALAWDNGNYIYALFGGSYSDTSRHYFYRYNISTGSWESLQNTPGATQGAGDAITWVPGSALGVSNDNYIFAIVGKKGAGSSFLRYSISSGSWTQIGTNWNRSGSFPAETDDGCSLVWTGGKYLFSLRGEDYESPGDGLGIPIYDFLRYDMENNNWTTKENIPAYPHDNIGSTPGGGGVGDGGSLVWIGSNLSDYIYAMSGNQYYPEPIWDNRFYRYQISTDNWIRLADLPRGVGDQNGPRLGHVGENIYYWVGTYNQPPSNGTDDKILGEYTPSSGLATPTLVAPASGSFTNDNRPTFRWDNSYVADDYELWVDNNSNFSSPEILENVTENFYTPVTGLGAGSYWWRVRAYRGGSSSGFSDVWTLTVDKSPPTSSVDKISPYWKTITSFTITATANDSLSGVSRVALSYRYSSDNSSWSAWTWFDNDTASPWSWTFTSPNGNGYYQFYSTARDNAGNEEAAPGSADAICGVDNTPPNAPSLVEPENGAVTDDNTPNFRWAAVTELSLPVTYTLQVANNSNFSSLEVNVSSLIDNTYTPISELAGGYHYWHVRAIDNAGNIGGWSVTWLLDISTLRGVEVIISPSENSGLPGDNVTYLVMVKNIGENLKDNYGLAVDDNAGWSPILDNNFFANLAPAENRITTLHVTIPSDAMGGAIDSITVTATSQNDNTVSGQASCTAQATILRGVHLSISPSSQENVNGGTLVYTVSVFNTGNVEENFQIAKGDNAGWTLTLDNWYVGFIDPDGDWVLLPSGYTGVSTLHVSVPSNAEGGSLDNVWVQATSKDNAAVFDNESCLALAEVSLGVSVSISPFSQIGDNGAALIYTVTISNIGNVSDVYTLENTDNSDWSKSLSNTSLAVAQFSSDSTTTLGVTIPLDAVSGMSDNITVIATSQADNTVHYNASCIAGVVSLPCTGTASIRFTGTGSASAPFLWGIRKVSTTENLVVTVGDNLRLIFLASDNVTVESEAVIWSRIAPGTQTVTFVDLIVPHDNGLSVNVKRVKLVLTDSAGDLILDNMAWYMVVQDDWNNRISWIILNWGKHNSSQQDQLSNEISSVILNWPKVPTSRDQGDFSQ
jgi:hypothetical protein